MCIDYGEENAKNKLKEYVVSEDFETFNPKTKEAFVGAIDWLGKWGCSRSFGLGTKIPWDERYLVESLSDSTIYFAYYIISHYLHSDLYGDEVGLLGIKPEEITDELFNYVFYGQEGSKFNSSNTTCLKMREEYLYYYPMDLRCSGKDLIKNHLTMSLYNHLVVLGEEKLPRGFFCNGWVLVNKEKMSKSLGNFYTVKELCENYGADASRIALGIAGDSLDDANVEMKEIDESILKLTTLEKWITTHLSSITEYRQQYKIENPNINELSILEFSDLYFKNILNDIFYQCNESYAKMQYRDVLREGFFNLIKYKEEYKIMCGGSNMRLDLLLLYVKYQLLLIYPIAPHFAEVMWRDTFYPVLKESGFITEDDKELISNSEYPVVQFTEINFSILKTKKYLRKISVIMNEYYNKIKGKLKGKKVEKCKIVVAKEYLDWQKNVMVFMGNLLTQNKLEDFKKLINEEFKNDKKNLKNYNQFGQYLYDEYLLVGDSVFDINNIIDEKFLIQKYLSIILKDFPLNDITVDVVYSSEMNDVNNKSLKASIEQCVPNKPVVLFD